MLRILIADDHAFIRKGLIQILKDEFTPIHIEEAEDTQALLKQAFIQSWDLIISDISMPGGGGLEALGIIKEKLPEQLILILSIYPEDQYALRVMLAGAAGYLNKDAAPEDLVTAVKKVLSGEKYVTPVVAEQMQQGEQRNK
ncbi:MAG: response regulator transcription factor [Chitinophagaceae bacterium]|nr:response regulator transcription factor [Chitinophagaceae bacterium]